MNLNSEIGKIVRIEMKTAFYQIVAIKDEEQVYIRQVFDKNINLKIGKAELCHKSWIRKMSNEYKDKLEILLKNNPEIRKNWKTYLSNQHFVIIHGCHNFIL